MEINQFILKEKQLFEALDATLTTERKEVIYKKLYGLLATMDENNWAYEKGEQKLITTITQSFLSQLDDESEIQKYVILILYHAPLEMHLFILNTIKENYLGMNELKFLDHLIEKNVG